ncbi:hypothetical protein YC2023_045535 [Brassica napus]
MEYHDTYVSFVFSVVEKVFNSTCGGFNSVFQFAVTISGVAVLAMIDEKTTNIETTCTKNHHGFNKGKRSSRSKEEVFFQSRKNVSNLRFDTYIWNQNISLKSWNTSKRNTTIQVEEELKSNTKKDQRWSETIPPAQALPCCLLETSLSHKFGPKRSIHDGLNIQHSSSAKLNYFCPKGMSRSPR